MLMVLAYFTIYFLENLLTMFPQVYLIYDTTFLQPAVWAALGLVALQASALELYMGRSSLFAKAASVGFREMNQDPEEAHNLIGGGKGQKAVEARHQELASLEFSGRHPSNIGLMAVPDD